MRLRAGSNDWVISGAHTESGRPLLSNDMHLPLRIPNTWYEAHLTLRRLRRGGSDAAGSSVGDCGAQPADRLGLYQSGAGCGRRVCGELQRGRANTRLREGWRKPEVRHEVIHVKRGRDVEMDVLVTRHGPIISAR